MKQCEELILEVRLKDRAFKDLLKTNQSLDDQIKKHDSNMTEAQRQLVCYKELIDTANLDMDSCKNKLTQTELREKVNLP
jgi:uncharacterized protein YdcH (DUF465 family)